MKTIIPAEHGGTRRRTARQRRTIGALLPTLRCALNDRVIQADMAPYGTGERELAANYLLEANPDDLFLYDRGYPAFVADGVKQRTDMLTPNPTPTRVRQCRDVHLPSDPLRVGLIRVELGNGEVELLATSLLDEKAYPHRAFAKLYALRWGIEEIPRFKVVLRRGSTRRNKRILDYTAL